MQPSVTMEAITSLAPRAIPQYLAAFAEADHEMPIWSIKTPLRVAHFIAQVLHETGGLTILRENMNYHAARICEVWPARFPTLASATPYERDPARLADKVYSGRMGNYKPHDGFTFTGRGLLQITGRASYERVGEVLNIDLVGNPDLAYSAQYALAIAGCEWQRLGCNEAADADDLRLVTRRVNGGLIGLTERAQWYARTHYIWVRPPGLPPAIA